MGALTQAVQVQLYWLSLLPIGYAFCKLAFAAAKQHQGARFIAQLFSRQNSITKAVLSFAAVNIVFSGFSLLFYVLHAPAMAASYLYLLLLLAAIGYYAKAALHSISKIRPWLVLTFRSSGRYTKALCVIAGMLLIFDYVFSLHIGAFSRGDAIFHVSRVLSILNNGFNVNSSFMSHIPETAYHYNVVYALYAVPCQLFHIEPMVVWKYSIAFFRMMLWFSFGMFASYIYGRWLKVAVPKTQFVALAITAAIASMSAVLFTANYPNQMVVMWMIIYIITLDYFSQPSKLQAVILSLIGLAATMTHPTYALALAGLTVWFLIVRILTAGLKSITKATAYYVPGMVLLLAGPLISKHAASNITAAQQHLLEPLMIHAGPLIAISPLQDIPKNFAGWVVFIAGCVVVAGVLVKMRRSRHWQLVLALVTFYPLVVYTPLFTVANMFLPAWLLQRFQSVNLLAYLYIPLAVALLLDLLWRRQSPAHTVKNNTYAGVFATLVLLICAVTIGPAYSEYSGYRQLNRETYTYYAAAKSAFGTLLTNHKVVLSNQADSYLLAGAFPVDLVAVEQGHSPVSAATDARITCQSYLLDRFTYPELRRAKVDYIVIPAASAGDSAAQRRLIETKPYLRLAAKGPYYNVYTVDKAQSGIPKVSTNGREKVCNYLSLER